MLLTNKELETMKTLQDLKNELNTMRVNYEANPLPMGKAYKEFAKNFFHKKNKYCVGMFNCAVKTLIPIFLIKFGYIMFWTFILDMLCKNGYTQLSWLILLFPFIMFFILIGLFILLE